LNPEPAYSLTQFNNIVRFIAGSTYCDLVHKKAEPEPHPLGLIEASLGYQQRSAFLWQTIQSSSGFEKSQQRTRDWLLHYVVLT